jgi:endoglucanase
LFLNLCFRRALIKSACIDNASKQHTCLQQYLAIGEAPDITQQAFQQRSRWSKGHFQVFWSKECPLLDGRLNLFYRLAYSSTCVSYLSAGLSVVVLNAVPLLTILFGWFPIALNFSTVVGITAYYGALNALSYYCLSWSHYKASFPFDLHSSM